MPELPSLIPVCPEPRPPEETYPRGGKAAPLLCHLDNGLIDVSVCVVNWNCRDVLRGCLESLLRQPQGVNLEVIVVDNASADGAADMVEREFPEVLLVRNRDNHGFARANNQAARLARGRYLFFLNNDTRVPPLALRRLADYADGHPEAGMIGPRLRNGAGKLQFNYRRRPTVATLLHRTTLFRWTGLFRHAYRRTRRQDAELTEPRPVEVLMGAAMLLRRETFAQCGPWDEGYTFGGEDMDLCMCVGRRYAVVYLPTVEITHYGRVSTRQHIRYTATHIPVGFVRFLRKSGTSTSALLVYKLVISLDAPLQWLAKAAQNLWRQALGRHDKAEKSRLAMRSVECFLREGLLPFWRA
jgi:N-acetylglucosaminyl-diphospho-decaprenol L-rhamnosyltransferase